jgi:hypothetical protein
MFRGTRSATSDPPATGIQRGSLLAWHDRRIGFCPTCFGSAPVCAPVASVRLSLSWSTVKRSDLQVAPVAPVSRRESKAARGLMSMWSGLNFAP